MDEEAYKKELASNGVELSETDIKEVKTEEEVKTESKVETEEDKKVIIQPEVSKKRSIYDEYKDKKSELKTEREMRQEAERKAEEYRLKVEAYENADTTVEKQEALDDLGQFANKIQADPAAIKEMFNLFSKKLKIPDIDESLKKDIADIKEFKATNAKAFEKQIFEEEYSKTIPALKTFFPNANDDEMIAIKTELDKLSHTKDWHDKSLKYIAFEHQEVLKSLVSPKKRGMESKGRKDEEEITTSEFNPGADYSTMTYKQQEAWEKAYRELSKTEGLATNANGKKILM